VSKIWDVPPTPPESGCFLGGSQTSTHDMSEPGWKLGGMGVRGDKRGGPVVPAQRMVACHGSWHSVGQQMN